MTRNLALLILSLGLLTTACFFSGDDDDTDNAVDQSEEPSSDPDADWAAEKLKKLEESGEGEEKLALVSKVST